MSEAGATVTMAGVLVGIVVAVVPGAIWVGSLSSRVEQLEKDVSTLQQAKPVVLSPDDPIRKACALLVGRDLNFTTDVEQRMKALNCDQLVGGGSGLRDQSPAIFSPRSASPPSSRPLVIESATSSKH